MQNIFNLFLFLLALCFLFMVASGNISWLYAILGILSSALLSIAFYKLNIIKKNSELLYLSFGFYHHFFKIYFSNFISSLNLIIDLAINNRAIRPLLYTTQPDEKNMLNPALLAASFNMSVGLFCISFEENKFLIHALNERFFQKFDLQKNCLSLSNINDDKLI